MWISILISLQNNNIWRGITLLIWKIGKKLLKQFLTLKLLIDMKFDKNIIVQIHHSEWKSVLVLYEYKTKTDLWIWQILLPMNEIKKNFSVTSNISIENWCRILTIRNVLFHHATFFRLFIVIRSITFDLVMLFNSKFGHPF